MNEQTENDIEKDDDFVDVNLGVPDFSSMLDEEEITEKSLSGEAGQVKGLKVGELMTMFVGMTFNFVATRKGAHWKLSADEANELSEATDKVIDEHFPDFEVSPLWMLGAVGTGIIAPRLMMDAAIEQQKQAQEHNKKEQVKEHEQTDSIN